MITTADQFYKELLKLIEEEYVQRRDNLAGGSAADYGAYMRAVGFVDGLRTVIELAEIAKDTSNKY